jgi:cellulose synthase operon protein C
VRSRNAAAGRGLRHLLVFALLGMLSAPLFAQEIDYDDRRSPALRRCDDPLLRGQTEPARRCYQALLRGSADLLTRAEANWALGDLKAANELFRQAVAATPRAVLPRLRWGRLFLAASQYADAAKLFQEALQIDPKDAGARIAMARLSAERFDKDVSEPIAQLIAENGDRIEAHLVAARVAIEFGRLDDATRSAETALKLCEQQQRAPLEADTLLAAIEVVRNRDPARYTQAALAYNPRYGSLFETLGYFEIIRRRYREADVWLKRAVEVQPDLWSAQRELGLNLMRLADSTQARVHLVKAYEGDPFNTTTVNTLRLLDTLGQYETVTVASPQLKLLLHKSESAALRPYVEQLASQSIATFSKRYGYTPDGPVTVELFPNHDDFAVRTAGLPGIGLLGVTFGHVVAMDSPSGRKAGEFHWGSTLWHEMAHVFTLSATQHRVPRWLSEGLSVFEEWRTGPTPGVSIVPPVLDAFAADKFLPVARLDEGFLRPSYENQVQISYQQAGLICLFVEQRWGFEKLVAFLKSFSADPATASAVLSVFEVAPEEFDKQFNAFMKQRFAPYLADTKAWKAQMTRAHKLLEDKDWNAARDAAQTAIKLLPEYTGGDSAYEVLAGAQIGAGNPDGAIAALQAWRLAGGWDPGWMRQLAALLQAAKRDAAATVVLAALNYADPLAPSAHAPLGELLLAAGQGSDALREYQVLLALQPLDTAMANYGMARAYRLTGDATLARRRLLEALDTAPTYRPAQKLLLEMTGDRSP